MLIQFIYITLCLIGGIFMFPSGNSGKNTRELPPPPPPPRHSAPIILLPPPDYEDKRPHPPPQFEDKLSHPPPQFEDKPPHPPQHFEERPPLHFAEKPPPPPPQPYDDYAEPRNYQFNYLIDDQYTGNYQTREETKDGPRITGSYSLREPTGAIRIVKYIADHYGFRAIVHRVWPGEEKPIH